jgi:hypothetical protein
MRSLIRVLPTQPKVRIRLAIGLQPARLLWAVKTFLSELYLRLSVMSFVAVIMQYEKILNEGDRYLIPLPSIEKPMETQRKLYLVSGPCDPCQEVKGAQ